MVMDAKPKGKVAEQVEEKICKGICLQCGKSAKEQKGPFKLGICDRCYYVFRMESMRMTATQKAEYMARLIRRGMLAGEGFVAMAKRKAKSLAARIASAVMGGG